MPIDSEEGCGCFDLYFVVSASTNQLNFVFASLILHSKIEIFTILEMVNFIRFPYSDTSDKFPHHLLSQYTISNIYILLEGYLINLDSFAFLIHQQNC